MSEIVDRIQAIRQHRAVRIGTTVLWILIVIPFLVYSFPMVIGAEHSFVVLSGSMEPTVGVGDVVIVNEVAPEKIEQGDIITFRRSGEDVPTTHRVIEVQGSGDSVEFITKGDANEDPDSAPVTPDQVLGRVMGFDLPGFGTVLFTIPLLGYAIQTLGTTYGFIAFFAIPFAILLASEVWSFARDRDGAGAGSTTESDPGDPGGPGPGVTRAEPTDDDEGGEPTVDADEPAVAAGTDEPAVTGEADGSAVAAEGADEEPGTYTFSMSELRLALVVLGAFIVYSLVVANEVRTVWSIMAAVGVSMATLLLGILYISSDPVDEEEAATGAAAVPNGGAALPPDAGTDRFVEGTIPPDAELGTTVEVESLDALAGMAAADRRWVVEDGGTYAVLGGDVTYTYTEPAGEPSDEAGAEAAPDRDGASPDEAAPAPDEAPSPGVSASALFGGAADAGTAERPSDGTEGTGGDDDG